MSKRIHQISKRERAITDFDNFEIFVGGDDGDHGGGGGGGGGGEDSDLELLFLKSSSRHRFSDETVQTPTQRSDTRARSASLTWVSRLFSAKLREEFFF